MVEIPELGDATDSIVEQGRTLVPWLPDPHTCPQCNQFCQTSQTFDPQLVEVVDSWYCENCGCHYYRDTD